MTVGIAVSGPRAGLAAFRALAAVEAVGRGAIGGFVSFAVITTDGALLRAETQRGGTRTLFTEGERTGTPPPPAFAAAPVAALMASGPNRPEPLSQFTPGDPAIGIVTGHRLPNMVGVDGRPINEAVLGRLAAGENLASAVVTEAERNPGADAGVIAIDTTGRIALANTRLVARREDCGTHLGECPVTGGRVGILHNAIHPHPALAALAASAAFDAMAPRDHVDFHVPLHAGTMLRRGRENCLHLTEDGRVSHITVEQDAWLGPSHDGAALSFDAAVRRQGRLIGTIALEPYCVVKNGRLVSMSGREEVAIGIRAIPPDQPRGGTRNVT